MSPPGRFAAARKPRVWIHQVAPQPLSSSTALEGNTVLTTLTTVGTFIHHGGPFVGFPWGFVLIPLFWILIFVLIFGIFGRKMRRNAWNNGWGPHAHWSQPSRNAEASLAERFAQGDIDEKEYRARLEVLRANAYPQPRP